MIAAGSARRGSPSSEEATLRALNAGYINSFLKADAAWYDAHLVDDYICIRTDGSLVEKAAFLESAKAGPGDVVEYVLGEVDVRIHGDAAFVTAVGSWKRNDGTTGKTRYIDAYARTASGWKVVSAQLTKVAQ